MRLKWRKRKRADGGVCGEGTRERARARRGGPVRAGAEPETARRMDVEGGTHGLSIQTRGRGAGAAAASRGSPAPGLTGSQRCFHRG